MTKQTIIFSILFMTGIIGLPMSFVIMKNFSVDGFLCGIWGGTWFFYFTLQAYKYIEKNGIGRKTVG